LGYSFILYFGGNAGDGGVICSSNGCILCSFADAAVKRERERERSV